MGKQIREALNTVVGKGSVFEGRFEVSDGIRVDGVLRGTLTSQGMLVVGASGEVEADPIRVKDAIVAGRVRGSLEASHRIKLEASAEILGDITAQILVVEEGAVLHGVCAAGDAPVSKQAPQSVEQAAG